MRAACRRSPDAGRQYGNASTEDLWSALGSVSQKPVKRVMDTWTKQTGCPIVKVEELDDRSVRVSQVRFLSLGPGSSGAAGTVAIVLPCRAAAPPTG